MKYDKDAKCKKCGESGASTEFLPSKRIYDSVRGKTDELMERTCGNCGCVWREQPLNR